MSTYSPFNRMRSETFTNVSGGNLVIYNVPKNSLITASMLDGSTSNLQEVFFYRNGTGADRKNMILWGNEDAMGGNGYVNGAAFVPAGTNILINSSGNFMSFVLYIFEID